MPHPNPDFQPRPPIYPSLNSLGRRLSLLATTGMLLLLPAWTAAQGERGRVPPPVEADRAVKPTPRNRKTLEADLARSRAHLAELQKKEYDLRVEVAAYSIDPGMFSPRDRSDEALEAGIARLKRLAAAQEALQYNLQAQAEAQSAITVVTAELVALAASTKPQPATKAKLSSKTKARGKSARAAKPTPARNSAASRTVEASSDQTFSFLSEKIKLHAGWSGVMLGGLAQTKTSYSLSSRKGDLAVLTTRQETKAAAQADRWTMISATFSLKDLAEPRPVVVDTFAQQFEATVYAVELVTKAGDPLIASEVRKHDGSASNGKLDRLKILFSDKEMAERVAKAFAHVIRLAAKRPEPF